MTANNPNAAANLNPAKPGEVRNPNGRPKGTLSLSTIIQNLLADEQFADKVISRKPGWWEKLPNKNIGNAIATAMFIKAMSGDVKAARWISKTGFGDKVIHDFEPSFFNETDLSIKVVKSKHATDNTEREAGDGVEPAERSPSS